MADAFDIAAAGAIGSILSDGRADEATRKWFRSLPPETQERLLPINPELAQALLLADQDDIRRDLEPLLKARNEVLIHAYPPVRYRAPIIMLFAIFIMIVGQALKLPGHCLVLIGDKVRVWAEGRPEEED